MARRALVVAMLVALVAPALAGRVLLDAAAAAPADTKAAAAPAVTKAAAAPADTKASAAPADTKATAAPADGKAAAAPADDKADAKMTFTSKGLTVKDGVLTFTGPSALVETFDGGALLGKMNTSDAFAQGKYKPETKGDAVIHAKDATGKKVVAVARLSEPLYKDGVVTMKVTPIGGATLLKGGEVSKAVAASAKDLPAEGDWTDVEVTIDSATMPTVDGQKTGPVVGALVGGWIGNEICNGNWVCAAVGAGIGWHANGGW